MEKEYGNKQCTVDKDTQRSLTEFQKKKTTYKHTKLRKSLFYVNKSKKKTYCTLTALEVKKQSEVKDKGHRMVKNKNKNKNNELMNRECC